MRILRFGSVGIINTVSSYLLFWLFIHIDMYYLLASALSYIIGAVISYFINAKYTFANHANIGGLFKFLMISIYSLAAGVVLLYLLASITGIDVLIAQVLVVLIRFPVVYLLVKHIIFKNIHSY